MHPPDIKLSDEDDSSLGKLHKYEGRDCEPSSKLELIVSWEAIDRNS